MVTKVLLGLCLLISLHVFVHANLHKGGQSALACTKRYEWIQGDCPKGDRWHCWTNSYFRHKRCAEHKWGHRSQFNNRKGHGFCYCCGSCPVLIHS